MFIRPDGGSRAGYKCFSCSGSGSLLDLVMLVRGVDFQTALDWIRSSGVEEVEAPYLRVRTELPRAPGSLELPGGVEKLGAPLAEWNSVPRDYALSRGITEEQVRSWGIGYALSGRLEGRLFLPIRTSSGRLANYAARSFVGHEKRYLAAGSWEKPDKNALFGEAFWPANPGSRSVVLPFEGALNGLAIQRALARAGLSAHLGGMSGLDQGEGGQIEVRTLSKLLTFRKVVIATDPDGPGDRAAAALERALSRSCDVERLELPEGRDACDVPEGELAERLALALRGVGAA